LRLQPAGNPSKKRKSSSSAAGGAGGEPSSSKSQPPKAPKKIKTSQRATIEIPEQQDEDSEDESEGVDEEDLEFLNERKGVDLGFLTNLDKAGISR
jgi:hypothetical protein